MRYIYNQKTDKLHIEGYCRHAYGTPTSHKVFMSEHDALSYDGRAVSLCKLCEKEREKRQAKK